MTFLCAPPCLKIQVIAPKMISTTAGGARRCRYGSERASTKCGTASAPTPPSTLLTAAAAGFLRSQNRSYRAWGLGELLVAAGGAALDWHRHRLGGDCLNVPDKKRFARSETRRAFDTMEKRDVDRNGGVRGMGDHAVGAKKDGDGSETSPSIVDQVERQCVGR